MVVKIKLKRGVCCNKKSLTDLLRNVQDATERGTEIMTDFFQLFM